MIEKNLAEATKHFMLLVFFFVIREVHSQDTLIYRLNTIDFQFDLHLFARDNKYEISYTHNMYYIGWRNWDQGIMKVKNKRIVLITKGAKDETNLLKVKLRTVNCDCETRFPKFKNLTGEKCLEIIQIRNKEFEDRILLNTKPIGVTIRKD